MKDLSRAARIGKQTEKICMISLIIIVGYFTTRTVVSLIFNIPEMIKKIIIKGVNCFLILQWYY